MELTTLPKEMKFLPKEMKSLPKEMKSLPKEIVSKILLYLECPIANLIKNEIKVYELDHNYYFTKVYKMYYISNILSFNDYYFDKLTDPQEYESFNDI